MSSYLKSMQEKGARLCVDAEGFVWWKFPDGFFTMARINPDDGPIPQPLTFFEPGSPALDPAATYPPGQFPGNGPGFVDGQITFGKIESGNWGAAGEPVVPPGDSEARTSDQYPGRGGW